MIPREFLKRIRQIELRTNRLVSEPLTGARALARFTTCIPAPSKTNPPLYPIRTLKRRERRAPQSYLGIPTGFRPPAQGCEATLGERTHIARYPNGVLAKAAGNAGIGNSHNRVAVVAAGGTLTQGSSCLATLGFETESRWDSKVRLRSAAFTPLQRANGI